MSLSGVLASETSLFGTFFFTSAATDFSEAGGMFVAPPVGAPGSAVGSDMSLMAVMLVGNVRKKRRRKVGRRGETGSPHMLLVEDWRATSRSEEGRDTEVHADTRSELSPHFLLPSLRHIFYATHSTPCSNYVRRDAASNDVRRPVIVRTDSLKLHY